MNSEWIMIGGFIIALGTIIGVFQPMIKLLKSLYDAISNNTKELVRLNEKNAYISKIIDNHENRLSNHEERLNKLEYEKD